MATLTSTIVDQPGFDSAKSPAVTTSHVEASGKINSITDFMVYQAQTIPETPLIAYPASENGASDFVDYTARELDAFADEAARWLSRQGLRPSVRGLELWGLETC